MAGYLVWIQDASEFDSRIPDRAQARHADVVEWQTHQLEVLAILNGRGGSNPLIGTSEGYGWPSGSPDSPTQTSSPCLDKARLRGCVAGYGLPLHGGSAGSTPDISTKKTPTQQGHTRIAHSRALIG